MEAIPTRPDIFWSGCIYAKPFMRTILKAVFSILATANLWPKRGRFFNPKIADHPRALTLCISGSIF